MGEWRRAYEVNWARQLLPFLPSLVVLFLCLNGAPFAFSIRLDWWRGLLNPVADLILLVIVVNVWIHTRIGVYVGDAGLMVRPRNRRRIVVPWQEIAYAELAEVPELSVFWQRGPCLGLVLVTPSGQRRPLPVKLAKFHARGTPYVPLTQDRMTQVISRINELAAGQRPWTAPPPGRSPFPPRLAESHLPVAPGIPSRGRTAIGPRSRFLLIIFGALILFATASSVWNSWRERDRTLEIGPPTPKPAANFVPFRPVGDVSMPLRATSADGSAFTSSTIVTSTAHPSGVAYLAGWRQGASLQIGSLDLASGQPLFPVVDLGEWKDVYQFAARPDGILVAGVKTSSSPHPVPPNAAPQLEVSFVALDASTGRVRWENRSPFHGNIYVRLYPHGVLAATGTGQPALLDWTAGAPQWTAGEDPSEPDSLFTALPAVSGVEPSLTAPFAATADLDIATPDDPRLTVRWGAGGDTWLLDSRTGDWIAVTGRGATPGGSGSGLVIGGSLYLSATFGRSGDVLYRFPADPPQPVEHGDSLWSDHGSILAIIPCGSGRLCLTEGPSSSQTGQRMILLDTQSHRMRALPDTVPTGGYAIGDRYVDPAGRVYDLTGALLGESSPLATAWWLTPGSLVGINQGDPAQTPGSTAPAALVAVSTVDGARTVLGQLPTVPFQATTGNGYLVYADDDGFHAWQYAQP